MTVNVQTSRKLNAFGRFFDIIDKWDREIVYYKDKRYYFYAFINFLRWIRDPTDSAGPAPKYIHRAVFSVGAQGLHRTARRMRKNPKTRDILENKVDLGKLLADREKLGSMPEGSVGHEYNRIINGVGEGVSDGYLLGGIIYSEGHFDRLIDWDDDAKYLMVRRNNSHDITHVISGYGTDMCGENLVNTFTIAAMGIPRPIVIAVSTFGSFLNYFLLKPSCGFGRWRSMCKDAHERGFAMAKQNRIDGVHFEKLLDQPIAEVRVSLGIPQHKHIQFISDHGHLKTKGMMTSKRLKKNLAAKNPKRMARAKRRLATYHLVNNGFGLKETMSALNKNVIRAAEAHKSGISDDEVRKVLHPA